jgi:hypothetical protein
MRFVKYMGTDLSKWEQNPTTTAVWRSPSTTGLVGQYSEHSPGYPERIPHKFGALGWSLYPFQWCIFGQNPDVVLDVVVFDNYICPFGTRDQHARNGQPDDPPKCIILAWYGWMGEEMT